MPVYDVLIDCLPPRSSFDNQCNSFRNKLLLMCKETNMFIANGRKGDGKFTCYNHSRSRVAASVVDYIFLTTLYNMYKCINYCEILDLNEFSYIVLLRCH